MFQNFCGSEKVYGYRGGGIKIFRRIIFLSQCREISWGHPVEQCFRNFPVPKKFLDERGGEYQDFPSKNISLTVSKNFLGQPFCAMFQEFSGSEKDYG